MRENTTDEEVVEQIVNDPYHRGLREHGEVQLSKFRFPLGKPKEDADEG